MACFLIETALAARVHLNYNKKYFGRPLAIDPSVWFSDANTSPLNQRAWVYQEPLISLRTLYFTLPEQLRLSTSQMAYQVSTTMSITSGFWALQSLLFAASMREK